MLTNVLLSGRVNTVEVDDIDKIIASAKSDVGEMIFEKDVIPSVGYLAYFEDNAGIIFGLHQADPKVGM